MEKNYKFLELEQDLAIIFENKKDVMLISLSGMYSVGLHVSFFEALLNNDANTDCGDIINFGDVKVEFHEGLFQITDNTLNTFVITINDLIVILDSLKTSFKANVEECSEEVKNSSKADLNPKKEVDKKTDAGTVYEKVIQNIKGA